MTVSKLDLCYTFFVLETQQVLLAEIDYLCIYICFLLLELQYSTVLCKVKLSSVRCVAVM